MKIGIISEFRTQTVNYGNNLQAYALNRYLRTHYPDNEVETLRFNKPVEKHITSYAMFVIKKFRSLFNNLKQGHIRMPQPQLDTEPFQKRLVGFRNFQSQINLCKEQMTWKELLKTNYDIFIVGSDVVWAQSRYFVNRIRFLDFKTKNETRKIAYAASFGRNWIPKENVHYIKRQLERFDYISLREQSAIQLLKSCGIDRAVHTLDPTLLLSAKEWETIEKMPSMIVERPYIFVYLLGTDCAQREMITKFGKDNEMPIITIPYANGLINNIDKNFGDVQMMDCSPEEWIWLIHHAGYIFTDSFHGIVFSTIFEKKFFALHREYEVDINVRLSDFLSMINESDKMISSDEFDPNKTYSWDYKLIKEIINEKAGMSKVFLKKALGLIEQDDPETTK